MPTRLGQLLLTAFGAFAIGLVVVELADNGLSAAPVSLVVTVGVAAGLVAILTRSLLIRLSGRPGSKPILPIAVARLAAVGIAAAITGALVTGVWLALLLDRLTKVGDISAARHDAIVAGLGAVSGALLAAAGQWLQRACRSPGGPAT